MTTEANVFKVSLWDSIIQNSIIEILGEDQAAELFNFQIHPYLPFAEIHYRLGEMLGNPSALGVEQRIGQAGFRYFLSQMGTELGFFQPSFKLLPLNPKTMKGFGLLNEFYQKLNNEKVVFTETEEDYQLRIHKENEIISNPFYGCHFLIGFIKEYMTWVGGGKVYQVIESECRSNGYMNCIYNINKVPFD